VEGPLTSPRLLVDAMNVIGSRPDGWWRDRPAAMSRLLRNLRRHAERSGDDVTVVYDGRQRELGDPGPVNVAFAPGGRDAADREIARRVEADADPRSMVVVTSDSELADRVRAAGAGVEGAGLFRRRLDRH